MTEPAPVRGNLADVSLMDVIQVVGVTERDGVLVVERPEERVSITFRGGRIVIAQLSPPRHHLASFFLERGWIDFETLHEALRRQSEAEQHRLIGQILVEMGALSTARLAAGLEHQIRAVLGDMLGWTFGSFALEEAPNAAIPEYAELGVSFGEEELAAIAQATSRTADAQSDGSTRDPGSGPPRRLDDASWLAKPRLALIATDDLLIRHGLELRLRSEGFALISVPGLDGVAPLLLASGDPDPALLVDLDLVGRSRTAALQAFNRLRRLRRQWPNLKLVTFGRQVPEAFYQFLLRSRVTFHVPRASVRAEGDIRTVRDFIEVLARKLEDDAAGGREGRRSVPAGMPGQS